MRRAWPPNALLAVLLSSLTAHGQAPTTFDAASIKPNPRRDLQGGGLAGPQPGGRFIALGVTLHRLVALAYDDIDVEGGPPWAGSERFDVNATAGAPLTPVEIVRLLQPLLADRFRLKLHTQSRERPVYALVLARRDRRLGDRLTPSDARCAEESRHYFPGTISFPPPCGDFRLGARSLVARGMTMRALAALLSGTVGRTVIDRTGLDAPHDLQLEWTSDAGVRSFPPDAAGASELRADGVTVFTALQEQLGLRLDATRAAVDVLVIDSAERPTPD